MGPFTQECVLEVNKPRTLIIVPVMCHTNSADQLNHFSAPRHVVGSFPFYTVPPHEMAYVASIFYRHRDLNCVLHRFRWAIHHPGVTL